jgi:hypothetical protein
MQTILNDGANATSVDAPGLPGEGLLIECGHGGNFHSGEGVGGKGGGLTLTLGRGGEGFEETAKPGELLVEDADGNPRLRVKGNGDVQIPGNAALGNATANELVCGLGGFLPGGRLFLPKGNVSGATTSDGKQLLMVNTLGGAVALEIRAVDIAQTCPLIIKDTSGNAAANPITITTEGGAKIDGSDFAVISDDWGSLTLVSDGTNLFKV